MGLSVHAGVPSSMGLRMRIQLDVELTCQGLINNWTLEHQYLMIGSSMFAYTSIILHVYVCACSKCSMCVRSLPCTAQFKADPEAYWFYVMTETLTEH